MAITDTDLMAYADGELDADAACAVEAIIGSDPEARAKVEMFQQTGSLLRVACAEGFYAKGSFNGLDHLQVRPSRMPRAVGRRFAAAACLLGAVAGFGGAKVWYAPESARDALLSEVAEYHDVFSREDAHLAEVAAADVAELQAWLGQRLGRSLPVPDLTPLGLRFAGGRMLVVDGKPVGELLYRRAAGLPVAICVTRMDAAAASLRVDQKHGMTLASWLDGSHAYVVVGDMDEQTAVEAAQLAAAQFRG